jgi:hypothetical protein
VAEEIRSAGGAAEVAELDALDEERSTDTRPRSSPKPAGSTSR